MAIDKDDLQNLVAKLKTERDELRVRINLAGKELRDEWQELEEKMDGLEEHVGKAKDSIVDTGREVGEGLDIVVDEMKSAYQRIRQRLSDDS